MKDTFKIYEAFLFVVKVSNIEFCCNYSKCMFCCDVWQPAGGRLPLCGAVVRNGGGHETLEERLSLSAEV